jgi:YHS domain-containing protein
MTTLDRIFSGPDKATDPVCGMEVNMTNPPGGTAEHEGGTYYFCASGCREAFTANPKDFVQA